MMNKTSRPIESKQCSRRVFQSSSESVGIDYGLLVWIMYNLFIRLALSFHYNYDCSRLNHTNTVFFTSASRYLFLNLTIIASLLSNDLEMLIDSPDVCLV